MPTTPELMNSYPDLHELCDWLDDNQIKTVAMESTGVYWIPLFEILQQRGFEAILVDARRVKNVPGRKTDVEDCQWIQQLHSFGLLSGCFLPNDQISVLRSYWRQRSRLVKECATQIHLMQKALEQMNVQLHKVLSDISGVSGMRIIESILDGERDPSILSKMKDRKVKASEKEIEAALTGNYRREHIFALKQAFDFYNLYQDKLKECDAEIASYMSTFETKSKEEKPITKTKTRRKNEPYFDLRQELQRITGVDLCEISGMSALTVQAVISEIGIDVDNFKTEKHYEEQHEERVKRNLMKQAKKYGFNLVPA